MKATITCTPCGRALALTPLFAVCLSLPGAADDIVKASSSTAMNQTGAWVGGILPSPADIAVFDDTWLLDSPLTTGGIRTWQGLRLEGTEMTTRVFIANTNPAAPVQLGSGGIDMSASPRDLEIRNFEALEDQTWTIAEGRTFTLGHTRFESASTITVEGGGSLLLNALAGSFTGQLNIDDATLILDSLTGGSISVGDDSTLDSEITFPTGSSLTLGQTTGAKLLVDPSTEEILTVDDLTLNGINVVSFTNAPVTGPNPILSYSTFSGDLSNLALEGADTYRTAPVFTDDGSTISVEIPSEANLVWTGQSNIWDVATTENWTLDGVSTSFLIGDSVTFDDTAASGSVSLDTEVTPDSITIDNDTLDYDLTGTGSIGGNALSKSGSASLTLGTSNTYSGGTLIDGGQVIVSAMDALGTGDVVISEGTLTVAPGLLFPVSNNLTLGDADTGTSETILEFSLGNNNILDMPTVVSSDAPESKAIIRAVGLKAESSAATYFMGDITLENRDLYFQNHAERFAGLSGQITGTGDLHLSYNSEAPLPQQASTLRITNNFNDFDGDVYVHEGTLQIGIGNANFIVTSIPEGSDIIVSEGAVVRSTGLTCRIGALRGEGDVGLSVGGSGTVPRTLIIGSGDKSGIFEGDFSDGNYPLALTKIGTGTQVINGRCNNLGGITVSGGVLEFNGDVCDSSIIVQAGGTLRGVGFIGFSNPATLSANEAGAIVDPGQEGVIGELLVGSDVDLSGGGELVIDIDESAPDPFTLSASDNLFVQGELDLTGASLTVNVVGELTEESYPIASYTTLTGAFAEVNLPAGYGLSYSHEGNSVIALVKPSGDYEEWIFAQGVGDATPTGDPDGDGLTNEAEYAFGLDPGSALSRSAFSSPIDPTSGSVSYTRRDPSLTGLSYLVQTSPDLLTWTTDSGAIQAVTSTEGDNQTVTITLSSEVTGGSDPLFIQLLAQ
ncbi:MAG: autotransporter-associated beta strand repeat-containing protein [Verrucomicrobiota bacterium JB023]|nr:autotransporter-associated beta strand repeat-containing protein [Verrucomicrobiota bacterium JB023]